VEIFSAKISAAVNSKRFEKFLSSSESLTVAILVQQGIESNVFSVCHFRAAAESRGEEQFTIINKRWREMPAPPLSESSSGEHGRGPVYRLSAVVYTFYSPKLHCS
jgi:hypothetical protein